MSSLKAPFRVSISGNESAPLELTVGDHFRICPSQFVHTQARRLTARQVDLVRIAMAIQLADSWVRRLKVNNGYRRLSLELDLLDHRFWERPESFDRLKRCVDFLSGGDDWSFRFCRDERTSHSRQGSLVNGKDFEPLVCLYSGGLDSAAGMAIRLAEIEGQPAIPVTVRSQSHRSRVIGKQFDLLQARGALRPNQLYPYQVGAYLQRGRMRREKGVRLREVTHRCRPFLFYSIAGLVASIEGATKVEVYESGIGAVNLPLVSGRPGWHTTRSTHPKFLRLMSDLVTYVNDDGVAFQLPFLKWTKAEMVARLVERGLSELALSSVSCIMHPLRRAGSRRQCGYCPACIFRRLALSAGGVEEPPGTYMYDLFGDREAADEVPPVHRKALLAFLQQVASLRTLDRPSQIPTRLRNHLLDTGIVSPGQEAELALHADLHRRYRGEWVEFAASRRGRRLWWAGMMSSAAVAV
jgi:7-cyano-7-deazaguanine synthase in queuosine biosynthesis